MELKKFLKKQILLILLSAVILSLFMMASNGHDMSLFLRTFVGSIVVMGAALAVTVNDLVNGPYTQGGVYTREEQQSTRYTPVNDIQKKKQLGPNAEEIDEEMYYHYGYVNGYCVVAKAEVGEDNTLKMSYSYKNKDGEFITNKWFDDALDFNEYGCGVVCDGDRYNIINGEGEILSLQWFYMIFPFTDGVAKVKWSDDSINFLKADGKLLFKEWQAESSALVEMQLSEEEIEQIKGIMQK